MLLLQLLALIAANAAPLGHHLVVHADYRVEAVVLLRLYRISCSGGEFYGLKIMLFALGVFEKLGGHPSSV